MGVQDLSMKSMRSEHQCGVAEVRATNSRFTRRQENDFDAPRPSFLGTQDRPMMPGISYDSDETLTVPVIGNGSGMLKTGFAGNDFPRAMRTPTLGRVGRDAGRARSGSARVSFDLRQAHDARHHGRYGPEKQLHGSAPRSLATIFDVKDGDKMDAGCVQDVDKLTTRRAEKRFTPSMQCSTPAVAVM